MILIVGGTGFIGRNLILMLQKDEMPQRVVSRRPDRAFLQDHAPGTEAITAQEFHDAPERYLADCTAVVYLASTSTPGSNLTAPWKEPAENVDAAVRAMHLVATHSDAHFVFLSSGGTVYGPTLVRPIPENATLNPISPYGLGKKMCEAAVDFMARTAGFQATVLRPANPVGPWQTNPNHGVVGALFRAATQNTAFHMLGDGSAVRDYFDIRDLARGIVDVIKSPEISIGQTWNIASGRGHSIREVHSLVEMVTGIEVPITRGAARPSDIDHVVLDISCIQDALGWTPHYDLEQTLAYTWAQFPA